MKNHLILILTFLANTGVVYAGQKVEIGDLFFYLDEPTRTAAVISPGQMFEDDFIDFPEDLGEDEYNYSTDETVDCCCNKDDDDISWIYDTDDEKQVLIIPASVTYNQVTYSVTMIGEDAFADDGSLTKVKIPNSVKTIKINAFYKCEHLQEVQLSNSVSTIEACAFQKCHSLKTITIGKNVSRIDRGAFTECDNLEKINVSSANPNYCSVDGVLFSKDKKVLLQYPGGRQGAYVIPDGVKRIGWGAFAGCKQMTDVSIPSSVTSIAWSAFHRCYGLTSIVVPENVRRIGPRVFCDCKNLTSVVWNAQYTESVDERDFLKRGMFHLCEQISSFVFGEKVQAIPDLLCAGLTELTSVHLPDSLVYIGENAFSGCTGLTSINIPEGVKRIDEGAFRGCVNLTTLSIPNSVTSIGVAAFSGLTNVVSHSTAAGSPWQARCVNGFVEGFLVYSNETRTDLVACFPNATGKIIIPEGVTNIGKDAFNDCSNVSSVVIPNSVKTIEMQAFANCIGMTSVTISNGVTFIGESAFYDCSNLTSVTIPDSITSIADYLFAGCQRLTSVTLPECITSIGKGAFKGCANLVDITMPEQVSNIGYEAFLNCESLKSITIPENVTHIASEAFANCYKLATVVWKPRHYSDFEASKDTPFYDRRYFVKTLIFGEHVEHIPAYLCYGWANLESVIIPSGVKSIGNLAFAECSSLTTMDISAAIVDIGLGALGDCRNLTAIRVAEDNTVYCSVDGVLFNKDKTLLIQCPGGKSGKYIVPEGVTCINTVAFFSCEQLTSLIIPSSITNIKHSAFEKCKHLKMIACHASVPPEAEATEFSDTTVHYGAFGIVGKNITIPLYVPEESIRAYSDAEQWRDFQSILPLTSLPDSD